MTFTNAGERDLPGSHLPFVFYCPAKDGWTFLEKESGTPKQTGFEWAICEIQRHGFEV